MIESVRIETGQVDASGVLMKSRQLFGSAVAQGDNEALHEIKEDRLVIWMGGEVFGPQLGPRMSGRAIPRTSKQKARRKMSKCLKNIYDKVMRLGGAGVSGKLPIFRPGRRGGFFSSRRNGSCLAATCLNDLCELRREDAAVGVTEKMNYIGVMGIAKTEKKVQEWIGSLEVSRLKGMETDVFRWLA